MVGVDGYGKVAFGLSDVAKFAPARYLDEYAFRYNNRDATGRGMFDAFLSRVRKVEPGTASAQ